MWLDATFVHIHFSRSQLCISLPQSWPESSHAPAATWLAWISPERLDLLQRKPMIRHPTAALFPFKLQPLSLIRHDVPAELLSARPVNTSIQSQERKCDCRFYRLLLFLRQLAKDLSWHRVRKTGGVPRSEVMAVWHCARSVSNGRAAAMPDPDVTEDRGARRQRADRRMLHPVRFVSEGRHLCVGVVRACDVTRRAI